MFSHYLRAFLCPKNLNITNPSSYHHLLRHFSSSENHNSFTINYLIQNCGFSPQTASKLSNQVQFNNSQNPNSVLSFFKSYGFSNSQLSSLIKTCPKLLTFDPNNNILPKINFLFSKGASTSDLVHIITKNPRFLYTSLENCITPSYDLVKSFLLSDKSTISALKKCACLLYSKTPSQNIQILLQNGVPESKVVILFRGWYPVFVDNPSKLEKLVVELKDLGFDPETTFFIVALRAKRSEFMWAKKIDVYKKWGWSEENIVSAFLRHPWCMLASVEKIEAVMQFLVNDIGWESLVLVKYPIIFMISLEKRIIPRAYVLKFLESKGLIKNAKLSTPFKITEDEFLKRYVNCFEKEASQLLKLYEEKKHVSNKVLKQGWRLRLEKLSQGAVQCDDAHQPRLTVTAI